MQRIFFCSLLLSGSAMIFASPIRMINSRPIRMINSRVQSDQHAEIEALSFQLSVTQAAIRERQDEMMMLRSQALVHEMQGRIVAVHADIIEGTNRRITSELRAAQALVAVLEEQLREAREDLSW